MGVSKWLRDVVGQFSSFAFLPWIGFFLEEDNACIPSGYAVTSSAGSPIRKKIMVAGGTDGRSLNILRRQTRFDELKSGYLPKIKMVIVCPKGQKGGRKFLAIVDKFSTAGAQRRTYSGMEVVRVWLREVCYCLDGLFDNPENIAAPAAMNGGDYGLYRIMEKDRLTIGVLNHQGDAPFTGN